MTEGRCVDALRIGGPIDVKAKTYETQARWRDLHSLARCGPVLSRTPRLSEFLDYWLDEVVRPSLAPLTVTTYETFVRLYVGPYLGNRRLDQLQVRDVRTWLNRLRVLCQCCGRGRTPVGQREGDGAVRLGSAARGWPRSEPCAMPGPS
jgi:hypothetical protein